jgi:acyl carrier protein
MKGETPDASSIQSWCINYVARILDTPRERIDPGVDLDRLGLDSSTAVALVMSLEEWLDVELAPELLFEYPTIASFSKHLASRVAERSS